MLLRILAVLCLASVSDLVASRSVGRDVSSVTVKITTDDMIREVDSKYSSFALGCTLVDKGWMTFDTHSTRLQTLARALSPAYLRLGGTWADFMYFTPDNYEASNSQKAKFDAESFDYKDPKYLRSLDSYNLKDHMHIDPFNITAEGFTNINQFALDVNMKFLYDHNVLIRKNGKWDPTNAKQILDFSIKHNFYHNQLFEMGNEPDSMSYAIDVNLTAEELAQDFLDFNDILKSDEYKKYYGMTKLYGDDTSHSNEKDYLTTFLKKAGKVITSVTWHDYYLDGSKATADDFLDPKVMDQFEPKVKFMKKTVDANMPKGTKMWLGETGSAYGGGAPNLSNRYCAGFLLIDRLGVGAREGIDVILRNTFYEGQYALVNEKLMPSPDYWISYVFKNLVGEKVLNVSLSEETRSVRLYAHCTNTERSGYPKGSVTLYGMNVYDDDVTLTLGGDLAGQTVHEFLFEHHSGGIVAEEVDINGKLMELVDDKTLPKIEPNQISGTDKIVLPGKSYAFYVLPKAAASICGKMSDRL